MASIVEQSTVCRNFRNGEWVESKATRFGEVTNSSTGEVLAKVPFCEPDEVDEVVQAAHSAYKTWREVPVVERARVMFRLRDLLERHQEELAWCVSREHGKTFSESMASIARGIEMVEFAAGIPSLAMGECLENLASHVDCETQRHPLGVCVGITPFNFPAMVPLWMFPNAVTCGNAFILKPSEKVPLSAMRIVELAAEAGLPPGVLSLVHGDKTCVDALLTHPLVQAISFVGSTPVAKHIYVTGTAHGKRVQANGGAKNYLIVMPDAHMEKSAAALAASAFGCAGERCMAGAIAVPVGRAAEPMMDLLITGARKMKVGRTDRDRSVDMGPLITAEHRDRVLNYIDIGQREGAELACDGRAFDLPREGYFVGPTIFDRVEAGMTIAKDEIFGPVLSVMRAESLDQALSFANASPFGNGAVIYTQSGHHAREFKHRVNAGMVGVNVGVPAPMAWYPFTGWNASFFGDLHIQGKEGVQFYTRQKMIMTRWFETSKTGPSSWGI